MSGNIDYTAKPPAKSTAAYVCSPEKALKTILAVEYSNDHSEIIRDELPAIISHWLQDPKADPILLDSSYKDKWTKILSSLGRIEKVGLFPKSTKTADKKVLIDYSGFPLPPVNKKPKFNFIDLFAGIGGFRIALESLGGKCVFSSEWDKHAKETYYSNYGEIPFGDITNFTHTNPNDSAAPEKIPSHDILCGGFPCQPFSQAGKQLGFDDARGTLFYDILTIAKTQRPKVLFLENVKRLRGHDKGRTFQVICNALEEIGYTVYSKVLKAHDYGVPQNRERIFIVAFSEPRNFNFPEPRKYQLYNNLGDILEPDQDEQYTISDKLWEGHQRRLREHKTKGNGFGYSLFTEEDEYANTISARYWKDGSEILIAQKGKNPRILSHRECARLQGYPEEFVPHVSKRHGYQQFGNSVAVPVIEAISSEILKTLNSK